MERSFQNEYFFTTPGLAAMASCLAVFRAFGRPAASNQASTPVSAAEHLLHLHRYEAKPVEYEGHLFPAQRPPQVVDLFETQGVQVDNQFNRPYTVERLRWHAGNRGIFEFENLAALKNLQFPEQVVNRAVVVVEIGAEQQVYVDMYHGVHRHILPVLIFAVGLVFQRSFFPDVDQAHHHLVAEVGVVASGKFCARDIAQLRPGARGVHSTGRLYGAEVMVELLDDDFK